MAAAVRNAGP